MLGDQEMSDALSVASITSLLSLDGDGQTALYLDRNLPAIFRNSDPTNEKSSINFYMKVDQTETIESYIYTMDCRAETMEKSVALAHAVKTEINQKYYSNYYIGLAKVEETRTPIDETDNYKTPISAPIQIR